MIRSNSDSHCYPPAFCSASKTFAAARSAIRIDVVKYFLLHGSPLSELIDGPTTLGDTDHRHVEMAAFHHGLQRRENLLVRQIAPSAKEHQCIGMGVVHWVLFLDFICRRPSPSARRKRSASRTTTCPDSPLHHAM